MAVDRSATTWVRRLADPSSWVPWHEASSGCGCTRGNELRTGRARVDGVDTALLIIGTDFPDGVPTLTAHAAGQIAGAFDRATSERLPVVAVAASGGVRLQEGTRTFVALAGVANAVTLHQDEGLLFLCYFTDPTTGGTLASWAGMATVRAAEPGALIALTGPRVVEAVTGEAAVPGASSAEQVLDDGLIDAVFPPELLRGFAGAVLHDLVSSDRPQPVPKVPTHRVEAVDAWAAIQRTREPHRPGIREFAEHLEEGVELRGDGLGADDPAVLLALGRVYGRRIVLVGHDRSAGADRAAVTAAGMRKAARGMRLAQQFGLPLVSIADTPGPRLDPAGEPGGIGFHIAAALADRARSSVTTVSVLLGEGGGGAALAFLPAQYTIAAESAWLAPLAPEGGSAVLHRTVERAAEVAAMQHVTSADLVALGVVDEVIAEDGDWMPALVAAVGAAVGAAVARTY